MEIEGRSPIKESANGNTRHGRVRAGPWAGTGGWGDVGGISVLPAGRSGWDCGVYAGAAEEETGKEVGDRLGKREADDSGEKPGGQPGKGTGVSAGVENSS